MGRGKLLLKRIENEKARINTYQKRKKGLKKKIEEISILCGIPTCMIIFGPRIKNQPPPWEVWPQNLKAFREVIDLYRKKTSSGSSGIKSYSLLDFLTERKRKIDDKVSKHRNFNLESKFPTRWDESFESFSLDQLSELLVMLDNNIEVARKRIMMLKKDSSIMVQNNIIDHQANQQHHNLQLVNRHHQQFDNHHLHQTMQLHHHHMMINNMDSSLYLYGGTSMHTMQNYDQYYPSLPSNAPLQIQGSFGHLNEFYGDPNIDYEFGEIKSDLLFK